MSKSLKIIAPASACAVGALALAYVAANQMAHPRDGQFAAISAANAQEVTPQVAPQADDAAQAEAPAETAAADEAPQAQTQIAAAEPAAPSRDGGYGLGREAMPEEIAAWDIDIRPDGAGLPDGSGDVWTGEEVFVEKCAACHGDFGEAVGRWPQLAMGMGTLQSQDPVKTVGSYWPYLSTVWDYVHRAMPFGEAQSLSPDEVYAITAYLLYLNEMVEDDFVLSKETFADVTMPNADGFFMDDRETAEYGAFSAEACMENCKDSVEIAMHATVLDVTPDEPSDAPPESEMSESNDMTGSEADPAETEADAAPADGEAETQAAAEPAQAEAPVETAAADAGAAEAAPTEAPAAEAPATEAVAPAEPDPELAAAGERIFNRCKACHQVGEGATNRTGPELNGILDRPFASVEDFNYSTALTEAAAEGRVWTHEELSGFLADPRGYLKGTKMSFAGLRSQEDIDAVIAYMQSAGAP
ncbi:c-type cytochrome [Paracoccus sp. TK19116]|uniref:C-type cytochrome n=1 Tax=Paracoccus albicereus TaxID=2922394 RepID=A0ABT1MVJ0_9RHOB|nr:c-type cytochrome [Paracoccus albicereus]MCQ0972144.1 c-type cytochrome [Paracoccus albicereus]